MNPQVLVMLIVAGVVFTIVLNEKKLKVSLIKEGDSVAVIRKGGGKDDVDIKIIFFLEKNNKIDERYVEMKLSANEIKNIDESVNEVRRTKNKGESLVGIKVVTENRKNYSYKKVAYFLKPKKQGCYEN